jgi:peptidoglycan/xylan/chitin deacetylase (PgdA/CDA1 family)
MYHRIAAPEADPWQLAVSPDNFEQHLQFLQKSKKVVPLQQLVEKLHTRSSNKQAIAITFDDGYLDNYQIAKPLLEKYEIPATFFITSRNIGSNREFWWDELEKIALETPELPRQVQLEIAGKTFFFELGDETRLTDELRKKHKNYVAYEPPTLRSQLYLKLWEQLTPLVASVQQELIEQIRNWAGTVAEARKDYCCMSIEEILTVSSNSLFCIGGHTASHPALAYHEKRVQQKEIATNRSFLENITKRKIRFFAYPSGNYNSATLEVLKEENFEAGFTTNFGCIKKKDNPYLLNRIQVNNWDETAFKWVIENA